MHLSLYRLYCAISMIFLATLTFAQELPDNAIVFVWNDSLMAQSIIGNELVATSRTDYQTLLTNDINVYSYEMSPLTIPPSDGYGFYQGMWSNDRSIFVYLEIAPNSPEYRVMMFENGQSQILYLGQVDSMRGYLVPVGWTNTGDLILLERYMLHNLREVRLWQYRIDTQPIQITTIPIPDLKGNSATLNDGWIFIGFDTVGVQGYLLNLSSRQLVTFTTSFALQDPPSSVFEIYSITVLGVVGTSDFKVWAEQPSDESEIYSSDEVAPFLHWMLPDFARSITCYPDSEWTDLSFPVECVGLTVPREYQGHEGTDIGGKPNGLALGTAVYSAARGIVIDTFADCESEDISCGDSYGNYILIEHAIVRNYNVETWFTGYAHLQTILVEPYTYIDEIGLPIALSGDTGLGGAHLHFEVRSPEQPQLLNAINPWDDRPKFDGTGLWVGGNDRPISAVEAFPPPAQLICQTINGNNIRAGPGIAYDIVSTTSERIIYEVFQIQNIVNDDVPGDWYHIRWENSDVQGWIWSGVMTDCTPSVDSE